MKLQGSHEIEASQSQIWDLLMDPEVLARITPGVDRLDLIGEDIYNAVAEVKIGPVKGSFSGQVEVSDKKPPASFKLLIDQKSKIGNAKAEVLLSLEENNLDYTQVKFDGQVRMSGILASTGQRVIGSVVAMLSKQFFTALEEEVKRKQESPDA